MTTDSCKGCSVSVRISETEIKKIFGELKRVKKVKLVSEAKYEERLAKCKECKYLVYGTTCQQCACLVQIKAKLANASCPYPLNSKW